MVVDAPRMPFSWILLQDLGRQGKTVPGTRSFLQYLTPMYTNLRLVPLLGIANVHARRIEVVVHVPSNEVPRLG